MAESNLVRLTGLWKGQSRQGGSYLAGSISPSSRLLIFPNKHKRKASEPDYVAYIAPQEKKEEPEEKATQGELDF